MKKNDLYKNVLLELYKLYVKTAEETSKKRIQTNHFYILINSFLVSASTIFLNYFKNTIILLPLFIIGIVISILWCIHIDNYRKLNIVKYSIIIDIEKSMKFSLFSKEWEILKNEYKYRELTKVEKILPIAFAIVYFLFLLYSLLF